MLKELFKKLSLFWLIVTLVITSIYAVVPGLVILFVYNKAAYFNFLLLSVARVGQKGINFLGLIYQIANGNTKEFGKYLLNCAISEDARANAYNGKFFSAILIKETSEQKFGQPLETLSDNLGENQIKNLLLPDGIFLVDFLNFIDKNHTIKAIKPNFNE